MGKMLDNTTNEERHKFPCYSRMSPSIPCPLHCHKEFRQECFEKTKEFYRMHHKLHGDMGHGLDGSTCFYCLLSVCPIHYPDAFKENLVD